MAIASAGAEFGEFGAIVFTDANCALSAEGRCDVPSSSAHASMDASYQITFWGGTGPGYIEPQLCTDIHGLSQGSFVTPYGSIESFPGRCMFTDIPIVFGAPLDVHLTLQAFSIAFNNRATDGVGANLYFRVLDAQMNPVASTASVVIPEPSTIHLLIATGLFLMGAHPRWWRGRAGSVARS
jgi:hypothetical protein